MFCTLVEQCAMSKVVMKYGNFMLLFVPKLVLFKTLFLGESIVAVNVIHKTFLDSFSVPRSRYLCKVINNS